MKGVKRQNAHEILSMCGQPDVLWDRAEGAYVFDAEGKKYLDFTSAVLVANIGHSHPDVVEAIVRQARHGLLTSYIFANKPRQLLVDKLISLFPEPLDTVALFSSGSEAVECCLKAALTYAKLTHGAEKNRIIGYHNGFHGRTLGSQLAGGISVQKDWIPFNRSCYTSVPFPDALFYEDASFNGFLDYLRVKKISPFTIAAVIVEPYQGGVVKLAPLEYMVEMRRWCDQNSILLIFDEVQAGFGRTGKLWGYDHYGIIPDLVACGKGLSCSLPISATVGKAQFLNVFEPGSMSTTHSGNPVACAAAFAALNALSTGPYIKNARLIEDISKKFLLSLKARWPKQIFYAGAIGGVVGVMLTDGASNIAKKIVNYAVNSGVLLFNPVGPWATTIKICPPLCIKEAELLDGLALLYRAFESVLNEDGILP